MTVCICSLKSQILTEKQMQNARATGYSIVAAKNPGVSFTIYMIPWDGINSLEANANQQINSVWHAQAAIKGNYFDQLFDGTDFTQYSSVVLSQEEFDLYKAKGTQWWIVCSTLPPFSEKVSFKGNVGIGTTNPRTKLSVASSNNVFEISPGGTTTIEAIDLSNTSNTVNTAFYTRNGYFSFNTGAYTERLRIIDNGNIGIGTAAPTNKLQIGSNPAGYSNNDFIASNANGSIALHNNLGYSYLYGSQRLDLLAAGNGISILTNGNVGIGTTNPLKSLHIAKNVANGVGASLLLQNENYSTNVGAETEILLSHLTDNGAPYRFAKIHTVGTDVFGTVDRLSFGIAGSSTTYADMLTVKYNGNVGIGTTNPLYKLAVKGTIGCGEVKVEITSGWADFVFHPTYQLRTLNEVEQFIKANNHLPEIPTAAEVKENGIGLGEMNTKLLQKVEELTLYMIEMKKENEELKSRVSKLEKK